VSTVAAARQESFFSSFHALSVFPRGLLAREQGFPDVELQFRLSCPNEVGAQVPKLRHDQAFHVRQPLRVG
jgi:hypothetical protein